MMSLDFRAAGYEYIHTNRSYSGGVVRQHGNLSFSRVFESGHDGKLIPVPKPTSADFHAPNSRRLRKPPTPPTECISSPFPTSY